MTYELNHEALKEYSITDLYSAAILLQYNKDIKNSKVLTEEIDQGLQTLKKVLIQKPIEDIVDYLFYLVKEEARYLADELTLNPV